MSECHFFLFVIIFPCFCSQVPRLGQLGIKKCLTGKKYFPSEKKNFSQLEKNRGILEGGEDALCLMSLAVKFFFKPQSVVGPIGA